MEKTLKTLQAIQSAAFKKGIHVFEITARWFEGFNTDELERGIIVSIFITGDDDKEDDYARFSLYEGTDPRDTITRIKQFIGED